MKLFIMIFTVVISISLIMLMIQVFKTVNNNESPSIENQRFPSIESPQQIRLSKLGLTNNDLIIQNLNWTINCNITNFKNLVIRFNGLTIPEYNIIYNGYYKYYYKYDCGKQLLWFNISSQYPILVGLDLV